MNNIALKNEFIAQAKDIFTDNLLSGHSTWKNTDYKFIAPSKKEYVYQWLWDTAFHAIVLSHFDTNWAKAEIKNHLKAQWDDGFIPHIIFWGGNTATLPHWAFIESKLSVRPRTSAITQPSAFPLAVEEIYLKDKDKAFLKEVLPKLEQYHKWMLENRDPDKDFLLSIISPNESGMDELPVFQIVGGFLGQNTARLHYTYRKGDILNQVYRYNSKKILDKGYFNCEELLFNCVFAQANRSLSFLFKEIGDSEKSKYFSDLADKCESAILNKCWDEENEVFYSLYSNDEKMAKVKTISSLMPLFLDNLKGDKLNSLITKHLLNPQEFWTPFPVPSVAADEQYYEPGDTPLYKIKLLWRGPLWINTNWFVVKGLRKHGFDSLANQLVEKMVEMIKIWGFREYYNPETGQGYRRENFGWSTLIIDLL